MHLRCVGSVIAGLPRLRWNRQYGRQLFCPTRKYCFSASDALAIQNSMRSGCLIGRHATYGMQYSIQTNVILLLLLYRRLCGSKPLVTPQHRAHGM